MRVLILGTDTDIGKTYISAALCHGLSQKKQTITYHKPLQTGGDHIDADFIKTHAPKCRIEYGTCFEEPMAPTHAAKRENKELKALKSLTLPVGSQNLIVEAAGGVCVPINFENENWIDYALYHDLPVFLVARNRLGTINHTCLTVKVLESESVDLRGVILSGDHSENMETLQEVLSVPVLHFPEIEGASKNPLWDQACVDLATNLESFCTEKKTWTPEELRSLDAQHIWHPFTQHKTSPEPVVVEKAKGLFVELSDGRQLMDCQSSWWVHNLGHGRAEVREAMTRQQRDLDHVIFAGTTHRPAVELAQKLLSFLPNLSRVFYSDNGSTAVEVGLKMAWQSHMNNGQTQRVKIAKLHGGYHGDTFGAMALGGSGFHDTFKPLLFETLTLHPKLQHGGEDQSEDLDLWFKEHGDKLSAVVIEPLMQGAGGMLLQDEKWLQKLSQLCKKYGVYVVADEVFTGMGRTGKFLASYKAEIEPDIVCLAKGLTGGSIPFAVTAATEEVFQNFQSEDSEKALLHGHTFAGNPIGCEIALSVLKLYEKYDFAERAQNLEKAYCLWAQEYEQEIGFINFRALGSIMAIELPNSDERSYFNGSAKVFHKIAMDEGLLLRPLGNTVYLVPPLLITESEIKQMMEKWTRALKGWNQYITKRGMDDKDGNI